MAQVACLIDPVVGEAPTPMDRSRQAGDAHDVGGLIAKRFAQAVARPCHGAPGVVAVDAVLRASASTACANISIFSGLDR